MKEAEAFLKKNEHFYRSKILKPNRKYRTIVKADYGVIRGYVQEVYLFPQEFTNLTEEEFVSQAGIAYKRRNEIDFENFQQVIQNFIESFKLGVGRSLCLCLFYYRPNNLCLKLEVERY